jgi:glycosyltransferase involved in cell wall biosynthesis
VRLGFHSPLPPARTGVADYSAALIRALRNKVEVVANPAEACDVELYHVGNNQLHARIYDRALREPGIVVLHDAVLQHFFLGRCDEPGYVEEFVFNYGEWTRDLARHLWRSRARSAQAADFFRYPMLRRLAESAEVVLVHNRGAASMVRSHATNAEVVEIPHLFEEPSPVSEVDVIRWRQPLGPGAYVFGVFGHLRESKRLAPILKVFQQVRRERNYVWLLVAGEIASSGLRRAIEPILDQPGLIRVDYLPERDFWLHAHACDACINLRYPAAGETSGIATRMMGIGKPVLLTASEETSSFPEGTCLRVDAGTAEEEMLMASMLWLSRHPEMGRRIGAEARRYIGEHHAASTVAQRYLEVLSSRVKAR